MGLIRLRALITFRFACLRDRSPPRKVPSCGRFFHTGKSLIDPVTHDIKLHDFGESRMINWKDPLDATWDLSQIYGEIAELATPLSQLAASLGSELDGRQTPVGKTKCFYSNKGIQDVELIRTRREQERRSRR